MPEVLEVPLLESIRLPADRVIVRINASYGAHADNRIADKHRISRPQRIRIDLAHRDIETRGWAQCLEYQASTRAGDTRAMTVRCMQLTAPDQEQIGRPGALEGPPAITYEHIVDTQIRRLHGRHDLLQAIAVLDPGQQGLVRKPDARHGECRRWQGLARITAQGRHADTNPRRCGGGTVASRTAAATERQPQRVMACGRQRSFQGVDDSLSRQRNTQALGAHGESLQMQIKAQQVSIDCQQRFKKTVAEQEPAIIARYRVPDGPGPAGFKLPQGLNAAEDQ